MSEVDRIGDANVDDGCTWKEEYKRWRIFAGRRSGRVGVVGGWESSGFGPAFQRKATLNISLITH
jgi:hypothetical protein